MLKQIGRDIGGAHVKAVLLDADGGVERVQQVPCPLWLGLDYLEKAMTRVLDVFSIRSDVCHHAITMTGELVDLFPNREAGVLAISQFCAEHLGQGVRFYAMQHDTFVSFTDVQTHAMHIASANWHASATWLAKQVPNAVLVDIGSTTTDIIYIKAGKVMDTAISDAERMQADTLVYTGVVRTPVMALAQKLMFEGVETNVAAEHFATMADVYRLTDELIAEVDMAETADGEDKTSKASAIRLARMIGRDANDKPMSSWVALAYACREKQIGQIQQAIMKHLEGETRIIGLGAGAFLVEVIAKGLKQPYCKLDDLFVTQQASPSVCFPAYAVAHLAWQERQIKC